MTSRHDALEKIKKLKLSTEIFRTEQFPDDGVLPGVMIRVRVTSPDKITTWLKGEEQVIAGICHEAWGIAYDENRDTRYNKALQLAIERALENFEDPDTDEYISKIEALKQDRNKWHEECCKLGNDIVKYKAEIQRLKDIENNKSPWWKRDKYEY